MGNEVTRPSTHELDGFGGFTDRMEGEGAQTGLGVSLLGLKLKFLNGVWHDPDEQEVISLLVVHDIQRKVQKWLDDTRPAETIVLTPGQLWPDIRAMNNACSQSEWREKFGKMCGPWQGEHVALFFDPHTMGRFWWPSPLDTIGSAICVRELVAQTKLMRDFKGAHVYPLVELSHTFFPTAYGGRERPDLKIKDWVRFGEGGSLVLPTPNTPTLAGGSSAPPTATATSGNTAAAPCNPLGMVSVEKPTAKEVTGDEIRF
jgi:hypothetical protein